MLLLALIFLAFHLYMVKLGVRLYWDACYRAYGSQAPSGSVNPI